MNNKIFRSLIILFIFTPLEFLRAQNIDRIYEVGLKVDFYARYFYRGFDYNLGEPVVQPNLFYSHASGFEFNLFTSFGIDKKTEFDEFDISMKYVHDLDDQFSASIGVVGIFFPNTQSIPTNNGKFDFTYELQAALNFKTGDLSASLLYAHDFKNADGDCIDINVSNFFSLSDRFSVTPVFGAVYQTEYGITGSFRDKFTALYLFLPLEIQFDRFILIPSYNVSYIPSEKMRKYNELYEAGYQEFIHFAGLSIKYNF